MRGLASLGVAVALACSVGCSSSPAADASSSAGAGGERSSSTSGAGGGGLGPVVTCPADNAPGHLDDLPWPAASNTGNDASEGDTVRFRWSGAHSVVQAASFAGQDPPTSPFGDPMWPGEIASGPQTQSGELDWDTGTYPCGYRPGIYFFVDEGQATSGVVAVSLTVAEGAHYGDIPASDLARPDVYGGAYASFAGRDATVHEVNNFQTETHFDWYPPTLTAKQGDLVVFRWTGEHDVVQVHDAGQDTLFADGLTSGPKTNCVGGPHYTCVDGAGEFVFDTKDWHPGLVHISDMDAIQPSGLGMNMEVDVRFDVPNDTPRAPVAGTCCAIDKSKGTACRVVEISNANDGAQLDYNVPVGRGDLVRFTWAGGLRIFQTTPNADGSPSQTQKQGGLAMPASLECIPGPSEGCLGLAKPVEFVVDVDAAITAGLAEQNAQGQSYFDFYANGDAGSGFTSANTGTIVYVDGSIPFDPHPAACP
ncbi:MAG TPA: hypothetical protein VGM56_11015 [Byssovorax sp.]|jgi:plastocyanin